MSNSVDDFFSAFGSAGTATAPINGRSRSATEQPAVGEPSRKRQKTAIDEQERLSVISAAVSAESERHDVEEVIVETYQGDQNCSHECVRPKYLNSTESQNGSTSIQGGLKRETHNKKLPARVFPYKLDPFQEKAVTCLESGESVLVSAHTSAGKTTVAEVSEETRLFMI